MAVAESDLAGGAALSEMERVVDTFVAPSKTFEDLRRSARWWLPFMLVAVCSYALTAAIQVKVGWVQLAQNEVHAQPKLAERLASLPPDQVASQQRVMSYSMQGSFYAAPVFTLALVALVALVLWVTINFGFGGSATYGRVFSVGMYASLPGAISALLAAVLLFAGRDPESFTTQAMLGSNPGYFIDTPGALKSLLSAVDVFSIWSAVLWGMGLAIVARTKRRNGYIAVFGWFILVALLRAGFAALRS